MPINPLNLVTTVDPDRTEGPVVHSAPFVLDQGGEQYERAGLYDPPAVSDFPPVNDRDNVNTGVPYVPPRPLAVLPTQTVGGVVTDVGQIVNTAGTRTVIIGASSRSRPEVLGIIVQNVSGAGTATIVPDTNPDSLGLGYPVPAATLPPMIWPVKRLAVQLSGAVVLAYAVIGSDIPQNNV